MSDNLSCTCSSHQQPHCVHWRMGNCPNKPTPQIIHLAERRKVNPGNGALEVMKQYFAEDHNWPTHIPAMTEADYFLAWLWVEGFKIVPLAGNNG